MKPLTDEKKYPRVTFVGSFYKQMTNSVIQDLRASPKDLKHFSKNELINQKDKPAGQLSPEKMVDKPAQYVESHPDIK